uniref:Agglutinin-like protein N-terminal domain-containing protein n=1 Tax=Candidozyma auris TaxID=498019 RepID=A0A0L0NUY3_CANAR
MKIISLLWCLALLYGNALAAPQTGVFTSIDSLTPFDVAWPMMPGWDATVSWHINSSMEMKDGDTFFLRIPFVIEFNTDESSIQMSDGTNTFANCVLTPGENLVPYSEVKCTATTQVEDVQSSSGTITFPIVFNAGFSAQELDLKAANHWRTGSNTLEWTDGSNTLTHPITFVGGTMSAFNGRPKRGILDQRSFVSTNTIRQFLMGPLCHSSDMSGELSIENLLEEAPFDCDSITTAMSNQINAWYFPQTADEAEATIVSCSAAGVNVAFSNLPAGFRPYINIDATKKIAVSEIDNIYHYNFTCNGAELSDSIFAAWDQFFSDDTEEDDTLTQVVVTTATDPGITATSIATHTGTDANTIVVNVPISESTVIVTGTNSIATTKTFTSSGTRIVSIDTPIPTSTITSTWTESVTSTYTVPASPGVTASVIVEVPIPTTTITQTWTGMETMTQTLPAEIGETQSVIVNIPDSTTIMSSNEATSEQTMSLSVDTIPTSLMNSSTSSGASLSEEISTQETSLSSQSSDESVSQTESYTASDPSPPVSSSFLNTSSSKIGSQLLLSSQSDPVSTSEMAPQSGISSYITSWIGSITVPSSLSAETDSAQETSYHTTKSPTDNSASENVYLTESKKTENTDTKASHSVISTSGTSDINDSSSDAYIDPSISTTTIGVPSISVNWNSSFVITTLVSETTCISSTPKTVSETLDIQDLFSTCKEASAKTNNEGSLKASKLSKSTSKIDTKVIFPTSEPDFIASTSSYWSQDIQSSNQFNIMTSPDISLAQSGPTELALARCTSANCGTQTNSKGQNPNVATSLMSISNSDAPAVSPSSSQLPSVLTYSGISSTLKVSGILAMFVSLTQILF